MTGSLYIITHYVCAVLLPSEGLTSQLSVQQQSQAAGSGAASAQSVPSWGSSGLGKAGVTSQLSQRLMDAITFHTMHTLTHTHPKKSTSLHFYSLSLCLSVCLSVCLYLYFFLSFSLFLILLYLVNVFHHSVLFPFFSLLDRFHAKLKKETGPNDP